MWVLTYQNSVGGLLVARERSDPRTFPEGPWREPVRVYQSHTRYRKKIGKKPAYIAFLEYYGVHLENVLNHVGAILMVRDGHLGPSPSPEHPALCPSLLMVPLRFRKAGRVWFCGAREKRESRVKIG